MLFSSHHNSKHNSENHLCMVNIKVYIQLDVLIVYKQVHTNQPVYKYTWWYAPWFSLGIKPVTAAAAASCAGYVNKKPLEKNEASNHAYYKYNYSLVVALIGFSFLDLNDLLSCDSVDIQQIHSVWIQNWLLVIELRSTCSAVIPF